MGIRSKLLSGRLGRYRHDVYNVDSSTRWVVVLRAGMLTLVFNT